MPDGLLRDHLSLTKVGEFQASQPDYRVPSIRDPNPDYRVSKGIGTIKRFDWTEPKDKSGVLFERS